MRVHVPVAAPMLTLDSADFGATLPAQKSFVASPNASGTFVYGCALNANACIWFKQGDDKVVGELADLEQPEGIGVDPRNGDLFIADAGGSDIRVFAPNSTKMLADYSDAGEAPGDVAVDSTGAFYVANILTSTGHPGSVSVYDPSGKRVRIITDANVYVGVSVSVDEHHLVTFCFNNFQYNGECDAFKDAREPGIKLVSGWSRFTGGATVDILDHLVVADQAARRILTFDGSTQCGLATLERVFDPYMVALAKYNRLMYVSDPSNGTIKEYPYFPCESGSIRRRMVYWSGLHRSGELIGVAITPEAGP